MKGLSFIEPMVKAWLAGNKTVTRRLVKFNIAGRVQRGGKQWHIEDPNSYLAVKYLPGETVYIKEKWAKIWNQDGCLNEDSDQCPIDCEGCHIEYKADTGAKYPAEWPDDSTGDPSCPKWKSPRFMPEWASRSHARIVSVRPERIRDISADEICKKGFDVYPIPINFKKFLELWDSLHPGSWDRNDWVWRIELEKLS
jgi:hypothetical protein